MGAVVAGDVVLTAVVLSVCLLTLCVGVFAVASAARAARCHLCRNWTVRTSSVGPVLCRSCLEGDAPAAAASELAQQGVGHDTLLRTLPRRHEPAPPHR